MKYMLLIYASERDWSGISPEEQKAMMDRWWTYTGEMQKAGVMLAGDALQPATTATTVRHRDGNDLVTDGPFAETKEVLGGYYLLEVPSVDEAIAWAKRCPATPYGTIEFRPVQVFDEAGGAA